MPGQEKECTHELSREACHRILFEVVSLGPKVLIIYVIESSAWLCDATQQGWHVASLAWTQTASIAGKHSQPNQWQPSISSVASSFAPSARFPRTLDRKARYRGIQATVHIKSFRDYRDLM
jgi:hypothetical protein